MFAKSSSARRTLARVLTQSAFIFCAATALSTAQAATLTPDFLAVPSPTNAGDVTRLGLFITLDPLSVGTFEFAQLTGGSVTFQSGDGQSFFETMLLFSSTQLATLPPPSFVYANPGVFTPSFSATVDYSVTSTDPLCSVFNACGPTPFSQDVNGAISLTVDAAATPLPAALPLFATGLGGLGLLGWRRKRKALAV
jgi:hypothetical protein